MIGMRCAKSEDFSVILTMIGESTAQDRVFLGYKPEHEANTQRNIEANNVIVMTIDEKIVGFIEYEFSSNNYIWIPFLYVIPSARVHAFKFILLVYKYLMDVHRLTIEFGIHIDNKQMQGIVKLVGARKILLDDDGIHETWRIDYEQKHKRT